MLRSKGPKAPEGGGPAYFSREYNDWWEKTNGFPRGSVEVACRHHIGSERAEWVLHLLKSNGIKVGSGGKLFYRHRGQTQAKDDESEEGSARTRGRAHQWKVACTREHPIGIRKSSRLRDRANATARPNPHGLPNSYIKARTNPTRAAGTADPQPEESDSEEREDVPDHIRQFYARDAFSQGILANNQDRIPPPPHMTEQATAGRSGRGLQRVSATRRTPQTPPSRPVRARAVRFALPHESRTPGHQTQQGDPDSPPPGTPPPRYQDAMSYSPPRDPPRYTRSPGRSPGTPTPAYRLYPEQGHSSEGRRRFNLPEPEPRAPTFAANDWPGASPPRRSNSGRSSPARDDQPYIPPIPGVGLTRMNAVRAPRGGRPPTPTPVRRRLVPEPEPEPMDIDTGYDAREAQAYIPPMDGIGLQRRGAVRGSRGGRTAVRRTGRRRPEPEPESDSWDDTPLELRSGPMEVDPAEIPEFGVNFNAEPAFIRGPNSNYTGPSPTTYPTRSGGFFDVPGAATGGLFANTPGQPRGRRSSIAQTPPSSSYLPRESRNASRSPTRDGARRSGRSQRRSQR